MIHNIIRDKSTRLFIFLGSFFIANAIIAEVIGVKLFSLEETLGISKASFSLLGESGLSFDLTVGTLTWPVVFIMTDIINEYYGMKGVRFLSVMAACLIVFAFLIFFWAIRLTPADFFVTSKVNSGVPDMDKAYQQILGQSSLIIIGSLTAFLVGQLVDVFTFHKIKNVTGEKKIWLRATGSTLISQLIDSFVVLFIAFYLGPRIYNPNGDFVWPLSLVLSVCVINYIYKFAVAILLTPVIYWIHAIIERYLGHDKAAEMKQMAMNN